MALPQPFTASTVLPYRAWDGVSAAAVNADLIAGARIYAEELRALGAVAYRRPAAIWGDGDRINVFASMRCIEDPGYYFRRWAIDSLSGAVLPQPSRSWYDDLGNLVASVDDGFYAASVDMDENSQATVEVGKGAGAAWSTGTIWRFGQDETTDYQGPIYANYDGNSAGLGGAAITHEADYGLTGYAVDFAIDRAADLVWFRMSADDGGLVRCFQISDKSLVATLYAPNATKAILPTGDGFVFVVDAYDWILLYDYDGAYWGGMRNPLGAIPAGGRCHGWDPTTRRLLELTATASASDGASTLQVRGFYPTPQACYLTKAIPRTIPRKGQTSYFFAHLYGDGGEPITSRPVAVAASVPLGITASNVITDAQGDAVTSCTPASTGANDAEMTMTGRTRLLGATAVTLPTATLEVWSTSEFAAAGTLQVEYAGGTFASVTYTGKTRSSFTGCAGGSGTAKLNGEVVQ